MSQNGLPLTSKDRNAGIQEQRCKTPSEPNMQTQHCNVDGTMLRYDIANTGNIHLT